MCFKTSPRYVGEFANRQYKLSKELEQRYHDDTDYVTKRQEEQITIKRIIKMYNTGLITDTEALKELLKEC